MTHPQKEPMTERKPERAAAEPTPADWARAEKFVYREMMEQLQIPASRIHPWITLLAALLKSACEEAVAAEREQIAKWHEEQGTVASQGWWSNDCCRRNVETVHEESAAAIRSRR